MKKSAFFLFLIISHLMGCREPYDPALDNNIISSLVVEGMINAEGITTINISRTQRLVEKSVRKFEAGAKVEIEGDNNSKFALTDKGDGVYASAANSLPRDRKYRLRIKTAAGREYLSDYASVKTTPPVAVTWKQDAEGVKVFANTKDPSGSSLYYHWLTEETWEIMSPLITRYRVTVRTNNTFSVGNRSAEDQQGARHCWNTVRSANILSATVIQSNNTISDFSLIDIPNGSEKLDIRYSVLVWQYSVSREAFEFFEVMKKNSEKMGSVFDPQPTFARGNISSISDPNELVVGFVDCSVPSSQRIFITSQEAKNWKHAIVCQTSYVANNPVDLRAALPNDNTLISTALISDTPAPNGAEVILGYNVVKAECVDCRTKGNNIKPAFW
ncbi:DUF4249 domain-containing protein [Daejeonella lutea]|uniref:DUF4249 domain-containing protein n=1 Tax=Daejeonella lutea TaxID=572036 RepID=A0A1T5CXY6_9SPHI|nr:DUF4249 domain-containing protein [Daejeonella lutea]SKB64378.1 protein of unknown function [Daejeonella lutea]